MGCVATGGATRTGSESPATSSIGPSTAASSATLINKDLRVALEAAAKMNFPIFVGSTIAQIWQAAVSLGDGGLDHAEIQAPPEDIARSWDAGGKKP